MAHERIRRGTIVRQFSACGCVSCKRGMVCGGNTGCSSRGHEINALGKAHRNWASLSATINELDTSAILHMHVPCPS